MKGVAYLRALSGIYREEEEERKFEARKSRKKIAVKGRESEIVMMGVKGGWWSDNRWVGTGKCEELSLIHI